MVGKILNTCNTLSYIRPATQVKPYDKMMSEKQRTIYRERDYKIEKPELVRKIDEKIETYSFPGQFITTNNMQNTFLKELKNKALQTISKKPKKHLRFDPTTEQVEEIYNLH